MPSVDLDELRAVVRPGVGLVVRHPGLICVVQADDVTPVRHLLAICASSAGPGQGRGLARRLAGWLSGTDDPGGGLRFGTVASTADGLAVFLYGAVEFQAPAVSLSGADAAAWTDRLLTVRAEPMRLGLADAESTGTAAGPLSELADLRSGVVAGVSVTLTSATSGPGTPPAGPSSSAPSEAPAVTPVELTPDGPETRESAAVRGSEQPVADPPANHKAPAQPPPPSAESPLRTPTRADKILGSPAEEPRPPLESGRPLTRPDAVRADPQPSDIPQAEGHLCARGHLNDPRSHFCVLCGIRMNERTGVLVFGARPPLGLLVFDDGKTYTVDAEYLVGRMPESDERVRKGHLRAIVVEDSTGAVSRVHAEIRVKDWDVILVDTGSRNGTFLAPPGKNGWSSLPARTPSRLAPGTRVRMGERTFVFESPSGVR